MAQIQDALGVPILANVEASGTPIAVNDVVLLQLNGQAGATFQIAGIGPETYSFEASQDGVNWFAISGTRLSDGLVATSTNANGLWSFATAGVQDIRFRLSAGAPGTATVTGVCGQGNGLAPFGGSVAVVGSVAVTGPLTDAQLRATPVPVDTELPAAAALADTAANPTAPAVDARPSVYNGATWDRLRGDAANGADVDVTRVGPGYQQTASGSFTALNNAVTIALQGEANVAFQLTGTWSATVIFEATVDGTNWGAIYAYQAGDNAITVAGVTINDVYRCTVAGFHSVRARCSAYVSGTVVVTARTTNQTSGVFQNFPPSVGPNPQAPVSVNVTTGGNNTVIAAPGAGLSIYVTRASVHNRAATVRLIALQDGAGGTTRWRATLGVSGGGSLIDFGPRGWKLTANTPLNANLDAAGDVDVNISQYYIAP